jgi:hypothetical protein
MTTTTTQTETTLLQLVVEYCQSEKQAQSKYFPLTEKAIEMFEYGLDKNKSVSSFDWLLLKLMQWKLKSLPNI